MVLGFFCLLFFLLLSFSQVIFAWAGDEDWQDLSRFWFWKLTGIHWEWFWMNQKNSQGKFWTQNYACCSNPTAQNKPRIQHVYKHIYLFFFFLLFKIKSQKKRHGTDFSNYQVSCHLLLQTKYHIIPYFINPLQSFRFFHYFALSHKKVKCKIPESKKKFIPIPFFYADN